MRPRSWQASRHVSKISQRVIYRSLACPLLSGAAARFVFYVDALLRISRKCSGRFQRLPHVKIAIMRSEYRDLGGISMSIPVLKSRQYGIPTLTEIRKIAKPMLHQSRLCIMLVNLCVTRSWHRCFIYSAHFPVGAPCQRNGSIPAFRGPCKACLIDNVFCTLTYSIQSTLFVLRQISLKKVSFLCTYTTTYILVDLKQADMGKN